MIFNQPKDYSDDDIDYTETETSKKTFNFMGLILSIVFFTAIILGITKCSDTLQGVIF